MNRTILLISITCLMLIVCLGLAVSNPSPARYRQFILRAIAEQETTRQEQIERHAIEQEAAALESYFAAVHYRGSQLDRAMIQRRYPKLGAALVSHDLMTNGSTLSGRLMQVKQQALQRVAVTRETILYRLLADLSAQTTRTSYAVWSHFSTCHNSQLQMYLGLAGRFYQQTAGLCMSPR